MCAIKITILLLSTTALILGDTSPNAKCGPGEYNAQLSDTEFWKGIDGAEYVEELSDDNYFAFLRNNTKTFVLYYRNDCEPSKQPRKGFAGAAKELKSDNQIKLASIECQENEDSCKRTRVYSYPTLVLFKNGMYIEEYTGPRTTKKIVEYVTMKGPGK